MKHHASNPLTISNPPASAPSPALSRRRFLSVAAAAWATTHIVPARVLGADGQVAPSNRINLAGIGVGGVGFPQLQDFEKAGFNIVSLCDVDDVYAKKAYDKWPQARRYRDFRELLRAEGDKMDAVHIATPDHTHALITLAVLKRGKHVCCVKPLTRTLHENHVIVEAARKARVATQVTAQPNTSDGACRTCELVQGGAIGAVREVHVWSNRPLWPQGMQRPPGEDAVPGTFDWKLWLGPAPERPFKDKWPEGSYALAQVKAAGKNGPHTKAVYHPWNFRGWWDFGTGSLGDMGCHYLNTPFRALKLAHPVRVQASATQVFEETAPLASVVTYDFPARDGMPPVRMIWYDGGLKPPALGDFEGPAPAGGALYIGDEGKMLGTTVLPASRAAKCESIPKTLPRRSGTWGEWFEACKGGEPAGCRFEWAGLLTETVLLGNIAIRSSGKRLEWDAAQLKFTNDEAANALVTESYQNGWSFDMV